MKNTASVKLVLYTHKTLSNHKHPIIFQVIKDRKVKRIGTGYSASKAEWDFENNKPAKNHKYKRELETVIALKEAELKKQVFNFDANDKQFSSATVVETVKRKKAAHSVFTYFDEVIKELNKANRISYAHSFKSCKKFLLEFNHNRGLDFTQIDVSFLNRIETDCKANEWKETSIASYLRTIRALFNMAINENLITPDVYPFKKYKIGKLKLDTQKRAIRIGQIELIENYKADENSRLQRAKNIFLFSFYTMGTNFIDMANLTWDNVKDGRLKYIRMKTKKAYNITLSDEALQILDYYKELRTDNYIFPIYSSTVHITPQQKVNRLHKVIQQVNDDLREIASSLGIKENLTTYVARHSAATILKRNGISTSKISELMGHETEEITQVYLDSFENAVLDEAVLSLSVSKRVPALV